MCLYLLDKRQITAQGLRLENKVVAPCAQQTKWKSVKGFKELGIKSTGFENKIINNFITKNDKNHKNNT